jgi:hypothetical protein
MWEVMSSNEINHKAIGCKGVYGNNVAQIGSSDGFLRTRQSIFGFPKKRENSCAGNRLVVSQELCPEKLVKL